jgi:2-furoyl-CoA dehydrogenase large subunit
MSTATAGWVGRSIERVEDAALLTGAGRFIDDLGVRRGTLHAAVLRSPHAHALIRSIKTDAAGRATGIYAIITGVEVMALSSPLLAGVKSPVNSWPSAMPASRSRWRWQRIATWRKTHSI